MRRIIKLTLGLLLAVCSACTRNGNALVLVFNEEQNIDDLRENLKDRFDAEISDIQVSIQENAYQYTVLFEEPPTQIVEEVFANCSTLASINIPDSVTEIGEMAFFECTSLASVNIPNSVTEIGQLAFAGCKSLSSVSIPNPEIKIGWAAFAFCDFLSSVSLPTGVKLDMPIFPEHTEIEYR